ncbi:MAG TPA: NAD(P)-dependent oxidoreductase [Hyphomicrobiaceae bacterium]|nr:NAD(P)-dependent oxidoreductase [Hyphomicrobiaceae bacterium]
MPITLGMFETSYAHIGERLRALGLDLAVHTFGKDGMFLVEDKKAPACEMVLDYMWLSSHINAEGFRDRAFDIALDCKSIGVLQTFNAGLDHPFYRQLSAKGARICNSSAQGVAIAEYTLGQVLAVFQPIEKQRSLQAGKEWQITPFREIWRTNWLIIGFGAIGQEIARRVKAFSATTSVVRRTPQASPLADQVGTSADLERFLPAADVVVLACSLNDDTRGLANATLFAALKPGAVLVNIARGGLIDDAAMLAALDAGKPAIAILDVFHQEPLATSNPLWTHPRVRLTSHTSFSGNGVRARWDQLFLDNIARFARGEPLIHEVDAKDI